MAIISDRGTVNTVATTEIRTLAQDENLKLKIANDSLNSVELRVMVGGVVFEPSIILLPKSTVDTDLSEINASVFISEIFKAANTEAIKIITLTTDEIAWHLEGVPA